MRNNGLFSALAVAALALLPTSPLQAEEVELINHLSYEDGAVYDGAVQGSVAGDCGSCGTCDTCCDDNCYLLKDCAPFWYAGTEFTFLSADTDNSGAALAQVDNTGTAALDANFSQGGYDDFTYAPRIWLGRQGETWGVVGRFWYLSDSDNGLDDFDANDVIGGSNMGRLKMYNIDLEVTRRVLRGAWKLDASGGVRYAALETEGAAATTGFFNNNDDLAFASASGGSEFHGTGITGALSGRRQIRCSNAQFFWNARGSFLWGDASAYAVTQAQAISPGAAAAQVNGAFATGGTDMFIGEFQVGVQWEYDLVCMPATAFFRTAFEYQHWEINGDGFAASQSLAVANNTGAFAAASSGSTDVDLYGLAIGTGFTW